MSNKRICSHDTPDPWVIAANGLFYLTFTAGDRIEIWCSRELDNFDNAQKSVVWRPQEGGEWGGGIWAPELHYVMGAWYVYFAGERPGQGNASHRTLLLRSSNPDPMSPHDWTFLGALRGVPDHWAIDATVFPLHGALYCSYSGWPLGDTSDTEQDLFLVRLISPEEADPSTLTTLSKPTLKWEQVDNHRVNEGPQFLSTPYFTGIVYSACGSWTNKYKLGVVQYLGGDPLDAGSWRKWERPLMMSDPEGMRGPHGPGHCSFIHSPNDPTRVYCIYHATSNPTDGWNNRKMHICTLGPEDFDPAKPTICCGGGVIDHPAGLPGLPGFPGGFPGLGGLGGHSHHGGGGHGGKSKLFDKLKDKLREL